MNDHKNDLDRDITLDALYPQMPSSFSERIDSALLQARNGTSAPEKAPRRATGPFGRRRGRSVMIACACAAAFVTVCGVALLIPALRERGTEADQVICAVKPVERASDEALLAIHDVLVKRLPEATSTASVEIASLSATHQGACYTAHVAYTLFDDAGQIVAAETAEIVLREEPLGFSMVERRVITNNNTTESPAELTAAPTLTPTPAPTITPPVEQMTTSVAWTETGASTLQSILENQGNKLCTYYWNALVSGYIADMSSIMETNEDTELWFYDLELQREMDQLGLNMHTSEYHLDKTVVESIETRADGYLYASYSVSTTVNGLAVEERFELKLDPQTEHPIIIGFDRGDGVGCYASLKRLSDQTVLQGQSRADANTYAYSYLSDQLLDGVALLWDGAQAWFHWMGEPIALDTLPMDEINGQAPAVDVGISYDKIQALLNRGQINALPADALLQIGEIVRNGVVVENSFHCLLLDAELLADACSGTAPEVLKALESLPSGTYVVYFTFQPGGVPAGALTEDESVAIAGSAPTQTPLAAQAEAASGLRLVFVLEW